MSAKKEYRITCDGCQWLAKDTDRNVLIGESVFELRKTLHELGWGHNYWTQEDFCDECLAAGVLPDYSKDLSGEFE